MLRLLLDCERDGMLRFGDCACGGGDLPPNMELIVDVDLLAFCMIPIPCPWVGPSLELESLLECESPVLKLALG